jgi:hypothetical protein
MKIVGAAALLVQVLLLTGCGDLLTLHALYTKQDQVFDPAMEGHWENEDLLLAVERLGDEYQVTTYSKKDPEDLSRFEMHLVDIDGVRLADLLLHDFVGHMLLRVRLTSDELHVAFFDSPWLRQQVPHDDADIEGGRKQAILTVGTAKLRGVVAKFAGNSKAYDDETVFRRVKPPR